MARKYSRCSVEDLERLVAGKGDHELVAAVVDELGHRTTAKARHLLRRLDPSGAHQTSVTGGEASQRRPTPPPAPGGVIDERSTSALAARYAALRATFTEEAEELALWGMTSLMPPRIRAEVIQSWRLRLQADESAHPLGLSLEDLAKLETMLDCGEPDGRRKHEGR